MGDVQLTWGVNRWVLIEVGDDELQRQVSSADQLAALLVEMGVNGKRSRALARSFWRERPSDAALGLRRVNEAMWRSTGLGWWQAGPLLLALIVAYVAFAAFH